MSRRQHAALLLALAVPLTAGTCSFSSSSGSSKVVVTTGECTPEEEMAGECETTPPESALDGVPGETAGLASPATISGARSAARSAPAVPEPGAALLFLVGAALVARRRVVQAPDRHGARWGRMRGS